MHVKPVWYYLFYIKTETMDSTVKQGMIDDNLKSKQRNIWTELKHLPDSVTRHLQNNFVDLLEDGHMSLEDLKSMESEIDNDFNKVAEMLRELKSETKQFMQVVITNQEQKVKMQNK
jgi:hypothetical protein